MLTTFPEKVGKVKLIPGNAHLPPVLRYIFSIPKYY